MRPWWSERIGHPGATNRAGWDAAAATAEARRAIARLIGARASEIVFTSGATEAANLAILGSFGGFEGGAGGRLLVSAVEHEAVLAPARALAHRGVMVERVPADGWGRVAPADIEARITADTALVSVQAANHELGTLQDVAAIGALCARRGIRFHVDAAQAVGRVPIDVEVIGCDLLSFGAHKMHGPPGIGALYVRSGTRLAPLLFGGGQEGGLRPGSLPVPLVVGFGAAAAIAADGQAAEAARVATLRDRLWQALADGLPGLVLNGAPPPARLPGHLSVTLPATDAEALLLRIPEIGLSLGAACGSTTGRPSAVLTAIGLAPEVAQRTLRIGLGRFTTAEEVDRAVAAILDAAR